MFRFCPNLHEERNNVANNKDASHKLWTYQARSRPVTGKYSHKPSINDVVERKKCGRADDDEELSPDEKRKTVWTRHELVADEEAYSEV